MLLLMITNDIILLKINCEFQNIFDIYFISTIRIDASDFYYNQ